MSINPKIHEVPLAETASAGEAIGKILDRFNDTQTGLTDQGTPLALVLRDDAGEITGGLFGRSYYNWLFIALLSVPETLRGRNIGRQLMEQAQTIALARGCTGIWLDTFSFQARGFYEKLGYEVFGEIADYPPGHSRFFLKKILRQEKFFL